MECLLDVIKNSLNQESMLKDMGVTKCTVKSFERDKYESGSVYKEYKYIFVFLIDTGDWYEKLIRFEVVTDTYNNDLRIRTRYEDTIDVYQKRDYRKISKYMLEQIIEYKESFLRKEKYKKIV